MMEKMGALSGRIGVLELVATNLVHGLGKLFTGKGLYSDRQNLGDELSQLTDRELADIGVSRSDLPAIPKSYWNDYGIGNPAARRF